MVGATPWAGPSAMVRGAVVIFSALFTTLQRLMGDVATTTVGWATVLLFGRVPQAQQRLLALITLGSLLWLLTVVCVVVPSAGGFVISLVPRPGFVLDAWLQAGILVLADRPAARHRLCDGDARQELERAAGLGQPPHPRLPAGRRPGATTIFLIVLSLALRTRAIQRGWEADASADDHQARPLRRRGGGPRGSPASAGLQRAPCARAVGC